MREGDLLDMAFLAPMIRDWIPYDEEIRSPVITYELISRSYQRIKDLYDEHQITIPIYPGTIDYLEMATAKTVVLGAIHFEPKEKEFLFKGLDPEDIHLLETAIRELVFAGVIFDKDGSIFLKHY